MPHAVLFHVAPAAERDSILTDGLHANVPHRWNLTRVQPAYGVYAWTTLTAARAWQSRDDLKHLNADTDIWQITLPDDIAVHPDPMAEIDRSYADSVVISDDGVLPEELTLITNNH